MRHNVTIIALILLGNCALWVIFYCGTESTPPIQPSTISSEYRLRPQVAKTIWKDSGSVLEGQKICISQRNLLYDPDKIAESEIAYKEWFRYQHLFIEKAQLRRKPNKDTEQEVAFDHTRLNMMGPIVNFCRNPLEKFGKDDEEKRACGLSLLEQQQQNGEECVVFSVGSFNLWQFEEAVYKTTKCRIEVFDCTVGKKWAAPEYIRDRTTLHPYCLGSSDRTIGKLEFLGWESFLRLANLSHNPTFLKMDIEGYEYEVLRAIIESGHPPPLQIAMEIHQHTIEHKYGRRKSSGELMAFMNYLRFVGGYHLIDRNDNPFCPHCSEFLLAKVDCVSISPSSPEGVTALAKQEHALFRKGMQEFFHDIGLQT